MNELRNPQNLDRKREGLHELLVRKVADARHGGLVQQLGRVDDEHARQRLGALRRLRLSDHHEALEVKHVPKVIHFALGHFAVAFAEVIEPPRQKRLESILNVLADCAAANVRARVLALFRAKRFEAGAHVVRQF